MYLQIPQPSQWYWSLDICKLRDIALSTTHYTFTNVQFHKIMCKIFRWFKLLNKSSACNQEGTYNSHHHHTACKFHKSIFPCTPHNFCKLVEPKSNTPNQQNKRLMPWSNPKLHKTHQEKLTFKIICHHTRAKTLLIQATSTTDKANLA